MSEGEVLELSSEEYSEDSDSPSVISPPRTTRKRGRRDTVKTVYTSDGQEVLDISSEEYSYSESD
jgi:hypothetical protein